MKLDELEEEIDWEKIYEYEDEDETFYEKWSFEISYFFKELRSNWYSFLQGLKNLIKYRKLIWNDRWYDDTFLHSMLRFKLNDMAQEWKNSHYIGSEYEERTLKELVQILDGIEAIEEDWDKQTEKTIANLYQEFGIKLFSITKLRKEDPEFEKGFSEDITTNFQRFWD